MFGKMNVWMLVALVWECLVFLTVGELLVSSFLQRGNNLDSNVKMQSVTDVRMYFPKLSG